MDIKKITEKITLPVATVISAVVLVIGFYVVQYNKQQSIERQQILKLQQEECNSLSSGAKQQWSNVVGVTYDSEFWKECIVTYTDTETGKIKTSPLRLMQDVK